MLQACAKVLRVSNVCSATGYSMCIVSTAQRAISVVAFYCHLAHRRDACYLAKALSSSGRAAKQIEQTTSGPFQPILMRSERLTPIDCSRVMGLPT